MFTKDKIIQYGELMKKNAEETLAEGHNATMQIGIWRHDRPQVWIYPPIADLEIVARIMAACIIGMGPDAVSLSADTWHSNLPFKTDGTPWLPGEMQRAVQEKTEDAHLVYDSFTFKTWSRDGHSGEIMYPYKRDGDKVLWEDPVITVEGEADTEDDTGGMTTFIRSQFMEPTMMDTMRKYAEMQQKYPEAYDEFAAWQKWPPTPVEALAEVDGEPEIQFAYMAAACIRHVLAPMYCSVAIGSISMEAHELIKERLAGLGDMYEGTQADLDKPYHEWDKIDGDDQE